MKVCLPIDLMKGLDSEIAPNFKAASTLLLVDTATQAFQEINASSGTCGAMPTHMDAIVCAGGVGRGMFNGLQARGVQVYYSDALTVADALRELEGGQLEQVKDVACCGGEGHHEHHGANGHQHGEGGCCSHDAEGSTKSGGSCCGHH